MAIPGLNFSIRQSLDRLQWQHDVYNEEFVQRLKLLFGHPDYFTTSYYGVVAPTDPTSNSSGGSEPLIVSATATPNALTVDINPGLAVTKSGFWILLSDFVRQVPLADTSLSVPNVVYLAYSLQSAPLAENDFAEWVSPLQARIGDSPDLSGIDLITPESSQVFVDTVETYVGYPEEVTKEFIPLAIVTVQHSVDPVTFVTTTDLSIDHTRDSYTWNRPWFSAVDIDHRSKLGSGTQSDNNPHALGLSDIDDGGWTIHQQNLEHGVVLARDQTVASAPGYRCIASLPGSQLENDNANGTETGFPNSSFLRLPYFPVRLGKVWLESSGEEFAAMIVPETNKIAFPSDVPPIVSTINVYYTRVEACEPPTGLNEISYGTNNPTSNELIIAGGYSHTTLASTTEAFADAYQFPVPYEIFVDGEGNLRKTPQVIYCYKRLDDIGTQDTPEIDQWGPAYIMMGLTGASGAATMMVRIRVYGKDESGVDVNYLFEFDNSWSDFSVPTTTFPFESFRASNGQKFASINNIVIEERTDDGPNGAIMIWALNNPLDTYDLMKDACHVSSIMWDGLRMQNVKDKRVIGTTNRDFLNAEYENSIQHFITLLHAGGNNTIFVEDFRRPNYHVLQRRYEYDQFVDPNDVVPFMPFSNFNKARVGIENSYRSRALPVFSGSGLTWYITLFPQNYTSGFNHFVPLSPTIRFKFPTGGWGPIYSTSSVIGIANTWYVTIGGGSPEVPLEFYVEINNNYLYQYTAMAVYG